METIHTRNWNASCENCSTCGLNVCMNMENLYEVEESRSRVCYLNFDSIANYNNLTQMLSELNISSSLTFSFGKSVPEFAPGEKVIIKNEFVDSLMPIFQHDLNLGRTNFVIISHFDNHLKTLLKYCAKNARICHIDPKTGVKAYNNTEFILEYLYQELEKGQISIPYDKLYSDYVLFEIPERYEDNIEAKIKKLIDENKIKYTVIAFDNCEKHFLSLIVKNVGMPTCRAVLRSLKADQIIPKEKEVKCRLTELCEKICRPCWRRLLEEMKNNSVKPSAKKDGSYSIQRPMFIRYEMGTDRDLFYLFEGEWVAPEVDILIATKIENFIPKILTFLKCIEPKIRKYKCALIVKHFMVNQQLNLSLGQILNTIQKLIDRKVLAYQNDSLLWSAGNQNDIPEDVKAQNIQLIKSSLVSLLQQRQGIPLHKIKSTLRSIGVECDNYGFPTLTEFLKSIPEIRIDSPKNNPMVRYSGIRFTVNNIKEEIEGIINRNYNISEYNLNEELSQRFGEINWMAFSSRKHNINGLKRFIEVFCNETVKECDNSYSKIFYDLDATFVPD